MAQICWDTNPTPGLQRLKFERCNTNNDESLKTTIAEDSRSGVFQCSDSNLNFSTATCSEDDCEYGSYKKNKIPRQDPLSHRIIEKRRRDRMNNCLADLSRLIPTEYLKKGRGRIEKTEIIEMAIKHIKGLQSQERATPIEHYRLGYQECMSETMRFMVEIEGHFPREPVFIRLLNHLQKHCDQISKTTENYSFNPSPPIPTNNNNNNNDNNNHHQSLFSSQTSSLSISKNNIDIENKIDEKSIRKPSSNDNEHHNNQDIHGFVHNNKSISEFEKDSNGGMTYKYKTDIKLRFSQDLNAHELPKKAKMDDECGNSIASFENQSSNQSPPPSSEPCTRHSDSEFTHNQTSSDIPSSPPQHHHHSMMHYVPKSNLNPRLLPVASSSPEVDGIRNPNLVENFNIPIFVLYTKGSYYIPLTIDYKTLLPFLRSYNIVLDGAGCNGLPSASSNNIVLHPVTINVNFLPHFNTDLKFSKYECNNNNWHH